jgi:hypothetical protein
MPDLKGGMNRFFEQKITFRNRNLKHPPENIDQECDHNTDNDHRGNRKIQAEIFSSDIDISRQAANPFEIIVKEIDHEAHQHNDDTADQNILTCLLIHINHLIFSASITYSFKMAIE